MAKNARMRLKEYFDRTSEQIHYRKMELGNQAKRAPLFKSQVWINGQLYAVGKKAKRSKEADENAAKVALAKLKNGKGTRLS